MQETVNVVNDTQAPVVAAPQADMRESGTQDVQTADTAPRPQSPAENAHFRKMRLENERLRSENERLTEQRIDFLMQEDLKEIQKIDPAVSSLEELGDDFAALIAAGVRAPVAFAAVRQTESAARPPMLGAVDGNTKGEKDYYTPQEVDALSEAELDNPRIWQRVRKSMTKW